MIELAWEIIKPVFEEISPKYEVVFPAKSVVVIVEESAPDATGTVNDPVYVYVDPDKEE